MIVKFKPKCNAIMTLYPTLTQNLLS